MDIAYSTRETAKPPSEKTGLFASLFKHTKTFDKKMHDIEGREKE